MPPEQAHPPLRPPVGQRSCGRHSMLASQAVRCPGEKGGTAMSTEENKAVVRQLYEALNQGFFSVLDDHPGLAAVKPALQHAYALAPNTQATIEELIAEGEWVATRLTRHGTLTSPGAD